MHKNKQKLYKPVSRAPVLLSVLSPRLNSTDTAIINFYVEIQIDARATDAIRQ